MDIKLRAVGIAKAGSALTLAIKAHGGLIATVEIGQGTLGFKAAGKHKFTRIPWSELESRLFPQE